MEIILRYGSGTVSALLPAEWHLEVPVPVLRRKIADPATRLEALLENPVHTAPFGELFAGRKKLAIIVPDITRKAGVSLLLPVLLERLEEAGFHSSAITVVYATGIHPHQSDEKKAAIVGENIFRDYRCVEHDCRSPLVQKGGLLINREVAEADRIIVIGAVKMHYLAGYSGGRKAILPGVSSYRDCLEFHRLCLNPGGAGRHPKVGPGMLAGNPMHERATRAARDAGVDFLVNVVLDEEGDFIFLNAGDLERSFEQACRFAAEYQALPIRAKAGAVIVSAGGYPSDINFIQTHKSLDAACRAVQPGGAVLLVSECRDGIGNADFLSWFEYGDSIGMERMLRSNFAINGHTAFATREKTERVRVAMLSLLEPGVVERMGMTPVKTMEEGIAFCERHAGSSAEVLVLRHGGIFTPVDQGQ